MFQTFCRLWILVSTVFHILQGCKMFEKDISIVYPIHVVQSLSFTIYEVVQVKENCNAILMSTFWPLRNGRTTQDRSNLIAPLKLLALQL